MDNASEIVQTSATITRKLKLETIITNKWFMYLFMMALFMYVILCGYVLVFSGSLFLESIIKGWYRPSASEYDYHSFVLGYLYGFASLCGVIGGLIVLSSKPQKYFRFKVLLFIPSVVWSTLLVLGNFRWGLEYWTQLLFLVPVMLLCIFVFFGVIEKINIPFIANTYSKK